MLALTAGQDQTARRRTAVWGHHLMEYGRATVAAYQGRTVGDVLPAPRVKLGVVTSRPRTVATVRPITDAPDTAASLLRHAAQAAGWWSSGDDTITAEHWERATDNVTANPGIMFLAIRESGEATYHLSGRQSYVPSPRSARYVRERYVRLHLASMAARHAAWREGVGARSQGAAVVRWTEHVAAAQVGGVRLGPLPIGWHPPMAPTSGTMRALHLPAESIMPTVTLTAYRTWRDETVRQQMAAAAVKAAAALRARHARYRERVALDPAAALRERERVRAAVAATRARKREAAAQAARAAQLAAVARSLPGPTDRADARTVAMA